MPQIKTRTGRPARGIIVDAALELFREHGLASVSLSDVASKVGITKAAVYHHFKTKDALILAAFGPLASALEGFLERPAPNGPRINELVDLAMRHREIVILGDPRLLQCLTGETRQVFEALSTRLFHALTDSTAGQPRITAHVIVASICAVVADPTCDAQDIRDLKHLLTLAASPGWHSGDAPAPKS